MGSAWQWVLVGVGLVASGPYVAYLVAIPSGRIRPHPVSWAIWTAITAIGLAAQIDKHAGPGTAILGIGAAFCAAITVLSLKHGRWSMHPIDWLSLAGALGAVGLWAVTGNPLGAVVTIAAVEVIGFVPSVRLAQAHPEHESPLLFLSGAVRMLAGILALDVFSVVTLLYPVTLLTCNTVFAAFILVLRRHRSLPARTTVAEVTGAALGGLAAIPDRPAT